MGALGLPVSYCKHKVNIALGSFQMGTPMATRLQNIEQTEESTLEKTLDVGLLDRGSGAPQRKG
jgi:hypothetical protein